MQVGDHTGTSAVVCACILIAMLASCLLDRAKPSTLSSPRSVGAAEGRQQRLRAVCIRFQGTEAPCAGRIPAARRARLGRAERLCGQRGRRQGAQAPGRAAAPGAALRRAGQLRQLRLAVLARADGGVRLGAAPGLRAAGAAAPGAAPAWGSRAPGAPRAALRPATWRVALCSSSLGKQAWLWPVPRTGSSLSRRHCICMAASRTRGFVYYGLPQTSASEPVLVPVRSCRWSSTLLRMQSPQQLQR